METIAKGVYVDDAGNTHQYDFSVAAYDKAKQAGMSVAAYINREVAAKHATGGLAPVTKANVFAQICASVGLIPREVGYGHETMKLGDVLSGTNSMLARDVNPGTRLLYPAFQMEAMMSRLLGSDAGWLGYFNQLLASNTFSINQERFERPVINVDNASLNAYQQVAQGALPPTMVAITTSDKSYRIPSVAIGMSISDQALALPFDIVTTTLDRFATVQRTRLMKQYVKQLFEGDVDTGQAGLTAVNASTLDSASTGGTLTQKAWLKYNLNNIEVRALTDIWCDLDTAMKVDGRANKPTVQNAANPATMMNAEPQYVMPVNAPKVVMMPDGLLPANTLVGQDARYGMYRVVNASADYQAVQEWVMQRRKDMRWDFGEVVYRQYDDAWSVLALA